MPGMTLAVDDSGQSLMGLPALGRLRSELDGRAAGDRGDVAERDRSPHLDGHLCGQDSQVTCDTRAP